MLNSFQVLGLDSFSKCLDDTISCTMRLEMIRKKVKTVATVPEWKDLCAGWRMQLVGRQTVEILGAPVRQ